MALRSYRFRAIRIYRLHPFFPTGVCWRYARDARDANALRKSALAANDFHKEIMKAFVLFFFSIKLIVLARRAKERVCAPGGIGFIAAEGNFDRAAKFQRTA